MITEAGLIGKIGINSAGVGVCLNAIKAKGVDFQRIPVHLALRTALESWTAEEAVQRLESSGVAAAAHLLIADPKAAIGLEVSYTTIKRMKADSKGRLSHTNHYKLQHDGVVDSHLLEDSERRDDRILEVSEALEEPTWKDIFHLFQDESDAPAGICRQQIGKSTLATLFNIIMDLKGCKAEISMGLPTNVEERITLAF